MPKKFVPRQRKHKVLARQKSQQADAAEGHDPPQLDSNAVEILPEVQKAAQEARRAELRAQLQGDSKISGQKAKRLEKYIDSKLKKDENRELLAKLSHNKIDTSLFSSTRSLGQGKETKRQALARALREKQAGVGGDDEDLLLEERPDTPSEHSNDSEDDPGANETQPRAKPGQAAAGAATTGFPAAAKSAAAPAPDAPHTVATGSGLKRPLELDNDGRPIIQKRQKRGGVKSKVNFQPVVIQPPPKPESGDDSEDEWNGFSSDASAADLANSDKGDSSEEASDADSSEEDSDEEEDADEEEEEEEEENAGNNRKQRSSAFKAWAHEQRNEALGYKPTDSASAQLDIPRPANFQPRPLEQDPLPLELLPTNDTGRKAYSVTVARSPEIQNARLALPVVAEEQKIMEAIHNNNVVVICGATGSGKTTQVPQFLFEAGYGSPNSPTPGLIGVTQPRKVAAVSMSKRVGQELGDHSGSVAYQIRFEGTADDKTAVKFMTDGVLLREVASDISLRKYSSIIIDEAHERSVNTDILIGMLSRVVKLREEMAQEDTSVTPLKLIIMSATLRVDDMTKNPTLFPSPPPVLNVEGRQHPVTVHFARQTKHDYVEEVFKKILRGHRKLPPGGFLVFLTGHDEISRLSRKLKLATGSLNPTAPPKVRISANDAPLEVEDIDFGEVNDNAGDDYDELPFIDDADADEDDEDFDIGEEAEAGPLKMHVLPLYSLLPTKEQMRVFEPPPEGSRQIIIATNVAETSLTIPGIRYVFDCGRSKERKYNADTGVQSYQIGWISKASADQRSGRAGRTGPGHCYRLYSSAVYERDFAKFGEPELLRMPIEGVVLQLKAMRLQHVINFPFPTPPDRQSIAQAERMLQYMAAVNPEGQATQIGVTMAKFPLPPRFARILLVGHLHDCLPYTVALVAGLSVAEIFIPETQAVPATPEQQAEQQGEQQGEQRRFRTNEDVAAETRQAQARQRFNAVHRNFRALDGSSDAIKMLQAVGEFAHEPTERWCEDHFVRFKALQETQKLRRQITNLLQKDIPAFASLQFHDRLDRPTAVQVTALKQMVAAGFVDQVAMRADLAPNPPEMRRRPRRAIDVPYLPLHPIEVDRRFSSSSSDDDEVDEALKRAVYVHPSSSLAHRSAQELPEYIVYLGLQRTAAAATEGRRSRTRMLALTDVTGAQLAALAKGTPLLTYGKPIKESAPTAERPDVRECWVVPYLRAEGTGGQGWPLPVRKVTQRRVKGRGWVVE